MSSRNLEAPFVAAGRVAGWAEGVILCLCSCLPVMAFLLIAPNLPAIQQSFGSEPNITVPNPPARAPSIAITVGVGSSGVRIAGIGMIAGVAISAITITGIGTIAGIAISRVDTIAGVGGIADVPIPGVGGIARISVPTRTIAITAVGTIAIRVWSREKRARSQPPDEGRAPPAATIPSTATPSTPSAATPPPAVPAEPAAAVPEGSRCWFSRGQH